MADEHTPMSNMSSMVCVDSDMQSRRHYDEDSPSFRCQHCRHSLTLFQCVHTPNDFKTGQYREGSLNCPHCGKNTAESYVQLLFRLDAPRHRKEMRRQAAEGLIVWEDTEGDDEEDEGENEDEES